MSETRPVPGDKKSKPPPRFWLFTRRAMRFRCPECGISPLFIPSKRVRSIDDWLRMLDGCPRCGYAYDREDGYFLLAIWALNYGVVGALGLGTALLVDWIWHPRVWVLIWTVAVPMVVLSVLIARHAKAAWLALDHYFDPHVKDEKDSPARKGE